MRLVSMFLILCLLISCTTSPYLAEWSKIRTEAQAKSDVEQGTQVIYYTGDSYIYPVGYRPSSSKTRDLHLLRNIKDIYLGHPLPSNVYFSAYRYNQAVLKELKNKATFPDL